MKRLFSKLCPFDLLVILAAIAAGGILWFVLHGETYRPAPSSSASWFLEDIGRTALRTTDKEKLEEIEHYNITYVVRFSDINGDYLSSYDALKEGDDLVDHYSGTILGQLKSAEVTKNTDGTLDAVLQITLYSLFDKVHITSPQGTTIKVGRSLTMKNADGGYLGTGEVTWISH